MREKGSSESGDDLALDSRALFDVFLALFWTLTARLSVERRQYLHPDHPGSGLDAVCGPGGGPGRQERPWSRRRSPSGPRSPN